jgi:hypothetical protein
MWYDVTFRYLLLAAAVSPLLYARGWGAHYPVVQEIYGSDPGYERVLKQCTSYHEHDELTCER